MARSQDLKAHEEGSTNPHRLQRHRSQHAAGNTGGEQPAERGEEEERREGGGERWTERGRKSRRESERDSKWMKVGCSQRERAQCRVEAAASFFMMQLFLVSIHTTGSAPLGSCVPCFCFAPRRGGGGAGNAALYYTQCMMHCEDESTVLAMPVSQYR